MAIWLAMCVVIEHPGVIGLMFGGLFMYVLVRSQLDSALMTEKWSRMLRELMLVWLGVCVMRAMGWDHRGVIHLCWGRLRRFVARTIGIVDLGRPVIWFHDRFRSRGLRMCLG